MAYQSIPSSFTWGALFDMQRRLGASSVSLSGQDQLQIVQTVSAFAYAKYMWPFTLVTTQLGQIPCQNKVQDYPAPDDLYRLSRGWLNVPVVNCAENDGTVPPYDDPSYIALQAAQLSANYVGSLGNGGGTPSAYIWPPSGSLNTVKRLGINLVPVAYTAITAITQQPNQPLLRLNQATAVASNQPYSLELEYQPRIGKVNAMSDTAWFPDDYIQIAQEGILYYLYRFNNDPRAGVASFSSAGDISYSGQLAVWMSVMEQAVRDDREGSVDSLYPSGPLGADTGMNGDFFFA